MEKESLALAYYELRIYTFSSEKQKKLIENFYSLAIPVLNQLQVEKVGVFNEAEPSSPGKLYIFLPYQSLEHFSAVNAALDGDITFQKKAAAYLNAPANEPAYERIESSLMKAFKNFPQIVAPENKERILSFANIRVPAKQPGKRRSKCLMTREKLRSSNPSSLIRYFGEKPSLDRKGLI